MNRGIIWLVVSCLLVLSFVAVSCAPKAPAELTPVPKEAAPAAPKETTPAAPGVVPSLSVPKKELQPWEPTQADLTEKPKYGGKVVISLATDVFGFDRSAETTASWYIQYTLVYEELSKPDLTMGPLGSNKADFSLNAPFTPGFWHVTGGLAESWEVPDNQTFIFKIRRGVHWQNKPPVNGREMTAEDVVYGLKREYGLLDIKPTYNSINAPVGNKLTDVYISPDDPWTVIVKVTDFAWGFFEDVVDKTYIFPPGVAEKPPGFKDWHNAVGTGPFMLTDYVGGSSLTFTRNPDWWFKNPVGPGKGDQLPYIDKVQAVVLPDISTQMSALRTAKIDTVGTGWGGTVAVSGENVEDLLKTNPYLKYRRMSSSGPGSGAAAINIRLTSTDPRAAPLMNQRVRWALSMAIDREAMRRDFYRGHAGPGFGSSYDYGSPNWKSPEQMVETLQRIQSMKPEEAQSVKLLYEWVKGMKPEEAQWVKKLYEYNPEEAKRILAQEGYPNGFKTTILIAQTDVDRISVIAGYWEKIGVDLELDVRETRVVAQVKANHQQPAMSTGAGLMAGRPERWLFHLPGTKNDPPGPVNYGSLYDPVLEEGITKTYATYDNLAKRTQTILDYEPRDVWLAWNLYIPGEFTYSVWQPWLRLYYGESQYGLMNAHNWLGWTWYDQDMKATVFKGK